MTKGVARVKQLADEAESRAARLRRMAEVAEELGDEGVREFIALLANGNGHKDNGHAAQPVVKPGAPRGREALRRIVRERPGIWTLANLRVEMVNRGWFTTSKGLEAAVKRLCDIDREGRRIGPGRYVFPANHGEEGAIESDRSGAAMIASRS